MTRQFLLGFSVWLVMSSALTQPVSGPASPITSSNSVSSESAVPQTTETSPSQEVVLPQAMDPTLSLTPALPPASITRTLKLSLPQLSQHDNFLLRGVQTTQELNFSLRKDHYIQNAALDLYYTASPALLPRVSHLRLYLNNELISVLPLDQQLDATTQHRTIELPTNFLASFNQLRLEFVGHYTEICEDPLHSSLWVDISPKTQLVLTESAVSMTNDLAYFPEPFFDAGDMQPQTIAMAFADAPSPTLTKAAALLSSYFGSQARWRPMHYPVTYSQLPKGHGVIFATNEQLATLLPDYPPVEQPTIELYTHPNQPNAKLLLVLGKTEEDVVKATSVLALGSPLLRGRSVTIDQVEELTPRTPYDAPYWTPTNRPVRFAELVDFPSQLETTGLRPNPININLNLPPDLFVWRNNGIPMDVKYQFSGPNGITDARLNVLLNNQLADSFALTKDGKNTQNRLRLALRSLSPVPSQNVTLPALKVGATNQMQFQFAFQALLGGGKADTCTTWIANDTQAVIEGDSVIDFSGYKHYLEMPNLAVFMNSGFPFSRMADYSETIVVVPAQMSEAALTTLLETTSHISADTGYPALKLRVTNDMDTAVQTDADILWIGHTPPSVDARSDSNMIYNESMAQLKGAIQPRSRLGFGRKTTEYDQHDERHAANAIRIQAVGNLAAIVGLQAPNYPQRSMVGLLANTDDDYRLLRETLQDSGKREAVFGSVAIIRDSGVHSESVGKPYFVGELSWWQLLWYHMADQAWILALFAALTALAVAILIWTALRRITKRRLGGD